MKFPHLLIVIALLAMFMSAQFSTSATAQTSRHAQVKRIKGTVKWFNDAKGFGFITSETGADLFYTKNLANGHTIEGECVTFEIGSSPKGPTAKRVRGCPGDKHPTFGTMPFPVPPKP